MEVPHVVVARLLNLCPAGPGEVGVSTGGTGTGSGLGPAHPSLTVTASWEETLVLPTDTSKSRSEVAVEEPISKADEFNKPSVAVDSQEEARPLKAEARVPTTGIGSKTEAMASVTGSPETFVRADRVSLRPAMVSVEGLREPPVPGGVGLRRFLTLTTRFGFDQVYSTWPRAPDQIHSELIVACGYLLGILQSHVALNA